MKKMYMIGNAHLDPVWLWPWQEGFQENKATCKSALERLGEYEDVIFTSSSAQFYEWIEKNDPEMFSEIEKRIREGRWVICGGWWVQPDCNIPCGESFARHALIAQNYFMEKFGVTAKTGYNVDSFGHQGMMPQILQLSGMENYVFMRPGPHEKGLPARNFIWESDDGSRVHAFRLPFSYCTFGRLEDHMRACREEFDAGVDELMCFYGVGNHGGGPTIENIETVKKLQREWDDVEIIFADPDFYFEKLKEREYDLPVVHGDLQHHSSGCYSAESQVKRYNRKAENALLRAEKFYVMSELVSGHGYTEGLTEGWNRVLFNQFHDILAGSSIQKAYEDTRNELGEALSIAARNENNSLQAVSFHIGIDQEENMLPAVVFNPHGWDVEEYVEVETGMFGNSCRGESYIVKDSSGNVVPSQKISSDAKVNGRNRIVFKAGVPSLGYAVFRIYAVNQEQEAEHTSQALVLENALVRVQFEEKTGAVISIWDKENKIEYCDGAFGRVVVVKDNSDTWSHGVTRFHETEGYFEPKSVKKTEDGPVRSSIRVISKYKSSTLVQIYTLYKEDKSVRVSAKINWQEKFRCVKIQFPVALDQYRGIYEIPFGCIEKACNGEEEPVQRWMDLSGMQEANNKIICGIGILNDCKYSACMEGNCMELTVLRSPVYAHHNPYILDEEEDDYQFTDQGIQNFSYTIVPHLGSGREAHLVQRAEELNQPCVTVIETYHKGEYPQKAELLTVSRNNVVLSALKKAEKQDGYILRLYETEGKECQADICIHFLEKNIRAEFKPFEIKTFFVSRSVDSEPAEVNFMEWEK